MTNGLDGETVEEKCVRCGKGAIKDRFILSQQMWQPVCTEHMFGARSADLRSFTDRFAGRLKTPAIAPYEEKSTATIIQEMLPLMQPVFDVIKSNTDNQSENENWWKVFLNMLEKGPKGAIKGRMKRAKEAADLAVHAWKTREKDLGTTKTTGVVGVGRGRR